MEDSSSSPWMEDSHVAAANAEMALVASQMGISSVIPAPDNAHDTDTPSPKSDTASDPSTTFAGALMHNVASAYATGISVAPRSTTTSTAFSNRNPALSPLSHRSPIEASFSMLSADDEAPHMFDCHGQRLPYYEGPYYIKYGQDGVKVKKRWCE